MRMALFTGRSPIPLASKGAVRDFIQCCCLSDGEIRVSVRFGARCNESGKSELHALRLSEIHEVVN